MASSLAWVFRFIHILAGVAWVGGAIIWSMVIAPRLLKDGPPVIRRPVLEALIEALPRYFAAAGGTTILFGILALGQLKGWANLADVFQGTTGYPAGGGLMLGVSLVLSLVMLGIGFAVIKPTSHKMLAVMKSVQGPPTPEVQAQLGALGKKMGIASLSTVLLGVVVLGMMTWVVNSVV